MTRVLILRAPGTNCDQEAAYAFERAGGKADIVHLNRALEDSKLLGNYEVLCIPGGFSYGDDISAGRIFGNQIRRHLYEALHEFKAAGKLILGICNGFQILIKSGVLLPDKANEPIATLTLNASGKFEDRWVQLRVASPKCVFLAGIESLYVPLAHAEGRFIARDAATMLDLEKNGQLVLRYAEPIDPEGRYDVTRLVKHREPTARVPYPYNPNGAQHDVAGICDETGRVLGLMPHPERHIDPTNHPRWTRRQAERGEGLAVFENAVRYFA